jgi:hypothetical protein
MTFHEGLLSFISQRASCPRIQTICPCEKFRPLARQVQLDPACASIARLTTRTIDANTALLTPYDNHTMEAAG